MRTVHETEALRPSDPVPKSMQALGGTAKNSKQLKIVIKTQHSHASGQDDMVDDGSNGEDDTFHFTPLTEEQGFSKAELALATKDFPKLWRLCRTQVYWAERDGEELKKECRKWEELYKKEWLEKEVLLDQVIKSETDWHERRQAVLSGAADVQLNVPTPAANVSAGVE